MNGFMLPYRLGAILIGDHGLSFFLFGSTYHNGTAGI